MFIRSEPTVAGNSRQGSQSPSYLRVEHGPEPLGITNPRPRFSWRLPATASHQVAYQLKVGEWDSGPVNSDEQLLVPYLGPALVSGQRVDWTVKVWTDDGESAWADPAWFEMGLVSRSDWQAAWISPPPASPPPASPPPAERPAPPPAERSTSPNPAWYLRGVVDLPGPVRRGRVYATAQGIYELFVNGSRVGDFELTPGWTSYRSRFQVQAYDVSGLLKPGPNVVEAVVSDGWFRGQVGGHRLSGIYGDSVAFVGQIDAELEDGSRLRFGTGADWKAATGPIVAADLMEGERVDRRAEITGWGPVVVDDLDAREMVSSPAPPVRRVEEIAPQTVRPSRGGGWIFDLGQNITGWARLERPGRAGSPVRISHAEAIGPDGELVPAPFLMWEGDAPGRQPNPAHHIGAPFQVDEVVAADDGTPFEPRHTVHGFRFAHVEGLEAEPSTSDLTGIVVHTDMRRVGWFRCSDERLNRLHDVGVWSFRGNACDVPTDCPTRERLGWTGDWQIFVEAAAFVYDIAGFSDKWLQDLVAEQLPDGRVRHVVPAPGPLDQPIGSSAGWGDAAVIVPWELYRAYDDRDLLERQWDSMTGWVGFVESAARSGRHPDRERERPEPAPHEEFLWDSGFHWGEWLEPDALADRSPEGLARMLSDMMSRDHGPVATAYFRYSSGLLARMAQILGRPDDAARYGRLSESVRGAWATEFVTPDGRLRSENQADYVRGLAFGLVPPDLRPAAAARLVDLVHAAGTHLGTGFLATPYLLPVLADHGHLDVAYDLLLQDTEPSWLAMIERGATTVWELWDGIAADGTVSESLNHYSKGAVISFLHRYVGGIRLHDDAPAYRRFTVAPCPGGGLEWADVSHQSPYGLIRSAWSRGDGFRLEVTVPPGTTAEVILPDGRRFDQTPGTATYT